jgi:sugar transferase (PEP-CTERM/EpsH1 system associated)
MKDLLFLAHRIPYPPNKGDKIRSFHFLKHLFTLYNVHLGTFIDDANDWQYIDKVDALCATTCYQSLNPLHAKIASARGLLTGEALSLPYYRNQVMQDWVDNTLKTHAIKNALIFSSVMGQFIKPEHDVEMVVDFVDVDSDKWRQYAEKKHGLAKWIYQREAKYLFDYEQALAAKAKVSVFVSEQEAALFKQLAPKVSDKISYINNGVNIEYFSPEHTFDCPYQNNDSAEQILVFTGAMDYWANVDAVKWFAEYVFPQVVKSYPAAKFYIVGSKPSKDVLDLASSHVIVTGAVPDVRPYLAYAQLAIAPLRIARGIQNKVLEAMSMAKHVVATSAAMEGIAYDLTLSVSVSDEAAAMVEQINALLCGSDTITSPNNRDFVKAHFSWENNLNGLVALLD